MATDDYDRSNDYHRSNNDMGRRLERHEDRVRDAHTNSHLARLLSILALILSAIALWAALNALNKATDALNVANSNASRIERLEQRP
jgi:hypothetical protein